MRPLPLLIVLGAAGSLGMITLFEYSGGEPAEPLQEQLDPALLKTTGATSPRADSALAMAEAAAPVERQPESSPDEQRSQPTPRTEQTPEQRWLAAYGGMGAEELEQAYQSLAASQHEWMLEEFHRQIEGGILQPVAYENSDALNAGVNAGEQTTGWGTFAMQQVTSEEDGRYLVYSATFHADEFEKTRELSEELLWLKRRIHEVSGK